LFSEELLRVRLVVVLVIQQSEAILQILRTENKLPG
jgi:hypothetical protein